jgi:transcription initiation factor TFIIIB Brf1 subunit/transcription initiation factor TFIIB
MTEAICNDCGYKVWTTEHEAGQYWCDQCHAVLRREDVHFPKDQA